MAKVYPSVPGRRRVAIAAANWHHGLMDSLRWMAAASLLFACGGGSVGPSRDAGPNSDFGGRDFGADGCSSDTDCSGGERCSVVGRCLGASECGADADCSGGERCGVGSGQCLATGACVVPEDCPEGQTCNSESMCEIGGECGQTVFETTRLAPNMMILLDRSGSMDNTIGGATRWDIAKDAIQTVTETYDGDIRFGLATYSSCLSGGCSAGSIVVPLAGSNASAINGFLDPLIGEGSSDGSSPRYLCDSGDPETSTGRSLFALTGDPLQDATRDNAVLLVTDGAESGSCTDGGSESGPNGAAALLSQEVPVQTYVVGFDSDVDAGELNAVASAGGTGSFVAANDAAALTAALSDIADAVVTCDFALDGAPDDVSMLFVYFDDDPGGVAEDPADGWTYDETTMRLTFNGASCDAITSGAVTDIDVVFGCPGPVID